MRRRIGGVTYMASVVAVAVGMTGIAPASEGRYTLGLGGPRTVAARTWAHYSGRLAIEGIAPVPAQRIEISVGDDWLFAEPTGPDGWYEIPVLFVETGTHRLEARTAGAGVRSLPLTVTVVDAAGPETMIASVAGARAYRVPLEVVVTISIEGRTGMPAGSVVTGTVRVGAPNPCWDDWSGACLDVEYEETRPFRAVTDHEGRFWASVGPYSFVADPATIVPVCDSVGARVTAAVGDREASGSASMRPCV